MTPIDIIKVINGTSFDRLIDSRDTNHEAQSGTKTTRAIIMTAHAHQIVFTSEKNAHDGITNIHVLTHPYATCHVLDLAAHNRNLYIENVLHHLNKSRRT